jgi:hypothetical protein
MTAAILVLIFGTHAAMAAPSGPPTVDIETTCRTSEAELLKLFGDNTIATYDACMKQEKDALASMRKDWASYSGDAKSQCIQTKNYMPSYVEWLTCLEMQVVLKDLRAKEADNQNSTPTARQGKQKQR